MRQCKTWMAALSILLLGACGQLGTPEGDSGITTLDTGVVTDTANSVMSVVDFGNVCQNTSPTRQLRLYAGTSERPGSPTYSNANVWLNGATLTVTAGTTNPAYTTTLGSFVLDANWQSLFIKSLSTNRAEPVLTFTAGSTLGASNGSVTYTLTGTRSDDTTLTTVKSTNVTVRARVIACNDAPVINIQQPLSFEGDTLGGWDFSSFGLIGTASDPEDGTPAVACSPVVGSVLAVGANVVSCTATDSGGRTADAIGTITVTDTTPPVISGMPSDITTTATGPGGATVSWSAPTAYDIVAGARPVVCAPASGSTFALGTTTVTCSAADGNGNSASASFDVIVHYAFGGWQNPLVALPTRNTVKAGRAIPVRFSLGGDFGLNIFNGSGPLSSNTTCTPAGTDPVEETMTAGSSSLSYDAATGMYTYVWKTESSWSGKCRTFYLNLNDGSTHSISFSFTK